MGMNVTVKIFDLSGLQFLKHIREDQYDRDVNGPYPVGRIIDKAGFTETITRTHITSFRYVDFTIFQQEILNAIVQIDRTLGFDTDFGTDYDGIDFDQRSVY